MELESLEFTVEDILLSHRGWITKLFVEDDHTEVEIVDLLCERRLLVTIPQIRRCLQDWNLLPNEAPTPSPKRELGVDIQQESTPESPELRIDTRSVSDGWELIESDSHTPSYSQLSAASNIPILPDSPIYNPSSVNARFDDDIEITSRYKERPLPSLPAAFKRKRKLSTSLERPKKDKLKLTCHHGEESHPIEMTLGILGQGPWPIETYASDDQNHERFAVGRGHERELDPASDQLPELGAWDELRKARGWAGVGNSGRMVKKLRVRTGDKAKKSSR